MRIVGRRKGPDQMPPPKLNVRRGRGEPFRNEAARGAREVPVPGTGRYGCLDLLARARFATFAPGFVMFVPPCLPSAPEPLYPGGRSCQRPVAVSQWDLAPQGTSGERRPYPRFLISAGTADGLPCGPARAGRVTVSQKRPENAELTPVLHSPRARMRGDFCGRSAPVVRQAVLPAVRPALELAPGCPKPVQIVPLADNRTPPLTAAIGPKPVAAQAPAQSDGPGPELPSLHARRAPNGSRGTGAATERRSPRGVP
jgi:hypothetical protein